MSSTTTTIITIYKFGEEAYQATRVGTCTVCGKKTRRSSTFSGTVNPLNTVADPAEPTGRRPKTREEVRADVKARAEAWKPEPVVFDHERCRAERDHPVDDSPVEPERRPEDRDLSTGQLLDAMAVLGVFVRHFALATRHVDIQPAWGRGREGMMIDVSVASIAEFMAWCDALQVEEVELDCTRDDTYLRVSAPMHPEWEGGRAVHVRMWQRMPRGPLGERLPGVDDTVWEWPRSERGKKYAAPRVPIQHIRTALRRLRIADQVEDPHAAIWADDPA